MAAAEPERQVYIRGYSVQVTTGRNNHALIAQFIGNLRHVRLRVGHEQVFSLRAVDRVAEAPSADCLVAAAVAALRLMPQQTGMTLSARRDRANQHAVADLKPGDAGAEFFNHADRLVADYEDWFDGIPSANDVKICAADRGECDTNHRFAGPRRAGAELHQC